MWNNSRDGRGHWQSQWQPSVKSRARSKQFGARHSLTACAALLRERGRTSVSQSNRCEGARHRATHQSSVPPSPSPRPSPVEGEGDGSPTGSASVLRSSLPTAQGKNPQQHWQSRWQRSVKSRARSKRFGARHSLAACAALLRIFDRVHHVRKQVERRPGGTSNMRISLPRENTRRSNGWASEENRR